MIIKNASYCIKNTLEHIKPFISYYTILDTGSQDNTIDIIKRELKDIKGILYEKQFGSQSANEFNFRDARNDCLKTSFNNDSKCKYIIELDDSFIFKSINFNIDKLMDDCYDMKIMNKDQFYYSTRIRSKKSKLFYSDRFSIHELLDIKDYKLKKLNSCFIIDDQTVESNTRSSNRYETDLKMLLNDLKNDKEVDKSRFYYYIAKTYYQLKNYNKAIEYYKLLESYPDYLYISKFNIALISHINLKLPLNTISKLYKECFDINKNFEPLYYLGCEYYQQKDKHELNMKYAFSYLRHAYELPFTFNKVYESSYKIYYEKLPYLLSSIAFQTNQTEYGLDILKKANSLFDSEVLKTALLNNTKIKFKKKSDIPLIVIHLGNYVTVIDIDDIHKTCSGSEIMAINMSNEFKKKGYNVILFGNFKTETKEYQSLSNYKSFLSNNYIDILIVSRCVDNLIYNDNIEKVYLWVHDVLPDGDIFQTHETKFKGVICLSEWHKQNICKEYNFPKEMVYIIGNCVYLDRFNFEIKKIPYKFVYTSCPTRGLDKLIELIQKIKKVYHTTTLNIFVDKQKVNPNTIKIIESLDYVKLNDRLSQDLLAKELLSCDIWLYPTHFNETFCITALECQLSNILCISTGLGSLSEINKGVIYKEEKELFAKLKLLENENIKKLILNKQYKWAKEQTYDRKVNEWITLFK